MILSEEKRGQLISYIVHAGEILQKENHFPKEIYKYLYVSSGSELYTGALKAAGYLFLHKDINNIICITEQNEFPNDIIGYINEANDDFLIRGRKIKNQTKKYTKKLHLISNEMVEQLLYLRLLSKIKSVVFLGLGKEINAKKIQTIYNTIDKETGVIFLGNMSKEGNIKEDEKMIQHMITKNIYKNDNDRLGNTYINLINYTKKKSELIVYVHSSELGIKKIQKIGYVCMVA